MPIVLLVAALSLVFSGPSAAASKGLPRHGVLVPGKTLAGIGLGETAAGVRARWGAPDRVCRECRARTWYYTYEATTGEPLGVGVSFRAGRVKAVFTLGSPSGWRTSEGLRLGEGLERARRLYGRLSWKPCLGYFALTMRGAGVVTSIYVSGESIYGFALVRQGDPICQ